MNIDKKSELNDFIKLPEIKPGRHFCYIYRTEDEHKKTLTSYINDGFSRNEKVLYIVETHLPETIFSYIAESGGNPNELVKAGRLVILTGKELCAPREQFKADNLIRGLKDFSKQALLEGYAALRISIEMTCLLKKNREQTENLLKFESGFNGFFKKSSDTALCQYDRKLFSPELIIKLINAHPALLIGNQIAENPFYIPSARSSGSMRDEARLDSLLENILETKREKLELKKISDECCHIFNSISDLIFVQDINFNILKANKSFADAVKMKPEQVVGKKCYELLHKSDKSWSHCPFDETKKDNMPHTEEINDPVIGKPLLVTTSPLFDERGLLCGSVHVARDLTENKRLEDIVHLTEYSINRIADSIFWINKEANFVFVNDGACRNLGYSREELLKMSVFDVDPLFPKEKWEKHWKEIVKKGSFSIETIHRKKDGKEIFVEVTTNIVDYGGKKYNCAVARDISDRKEAELKIKRVQEQLSSLVYNLPGAVYRCSFDKSWTMLYLSDYMHELCGYKANDFIDNSVRSFARIIHPEDLDFVDKSIHDAANEDRHWEIEYRIICRDKRVKWVHERGRMFFDSNRNKVFLDGIIMDISDKKKAEDEKRALESLLYQSQKMEALGQLAGGIAHDMNNILTSIFGYSKILLGEYPESDAKREYIQNIHTLGEKGIGMVEQILNYSKQREMILKPVNLASTVKETLKLLSSILKYSAEVTLSVIPYTPPKIRANEPQITQMLMNLILNACDAMNRKWGRINIIIDDVLLSGEKLFSENLKEGRYIKLTISDNGTGMTPDVKEKIFKTFYTSKGDRGTGLGLAIVKRVVETHDGAIEVESAQGQGSTFNIYFPSVKP